MTKKQQLYYLLEAFKEGKYDIPTFCRAYEEVFYPDIPFDELSDHELEVFNYLGDIVARFSPYEEDLKMYPNAYFTSDDVENAINKTCIVLNK